MPRLFLVLLLFLLSHAVHAATRGVALIVGNAAYPDIPLKNPVNDASDLATTLERAGFEVMLKKNLDGDAMKEAIAEFGDRLAREQKVGLFYFSGHGISVKGKNYMLPVGRRYKRERDVEFYAVDARNVLSQMENVGNRLNIVILDACRDSPLPPDARTSGSRGLVRMEAPSGSIIAFATAPGQTASDNPRGRNGLYTKHLIAAIETPGLRLEDVFKQVGRQVEQDSDRQQSPEEMMKLRDTTPFYFFPGAASAVPDTAARPAAKAEPARPVPSVRSDDPVESAYWGEVTKGDAADLYRAYLTVYPNGLHVADANEWLEKDKRIHEARERLKEDQTWKKAEDANTWAGYAAYLKAYPSGRYVPLANLKQGRLKPAIVAGQIIQDCPDCPEMVVIPAGSFEMGSNDGDSDEKPVHEVHVPAFALAKTEVTQGQWRAIMGSNPSSFSSCGDDCPVEKVSWDDAKEYLRKLSTKTGQTYRLPSEAEWEYAARAGTRTKYWWGDEASHEYMNYGKDECCDGLASGRDRWVNTAPVAQFPANAFGLYDMNGNVREWAEDCWHDSYNGAPTDGSAWTSGCTTMSRAVRAGFWMDGLADSRTAYRYRFDSAHRSSGLGFRPARIVSP